MECKIRVVSAHTEVGGCHVRLDFVALLVVIMAAGNGSLLMRITGQLFDIFQAAYKDEFVE